jgi:hypothetical protein
VLDYTHSYRGFSSYSSFTKSGFGLNPIMEMCLCLT